MKAAFSQKDNFYRSIEPKEAVVHCCNKPFVQSLAQSEFLNSPSDLVPGVYEGGFKVWECTQDVLEMLAQNELNVNGKKVLDAGCGSGLLGIKCLLDGAQHVVLQDYNIQVIELCTLANLLLNLKLKFPASELDELVEKWKVNCQLVAGDWEAFHFTQHKFDLILSSETIYNEENYSKLLHLFKRCLAKDGKVIVACKSHYFGVGGGSDSFKDFVEQEGSFRCQVVKQVDTPLRRDILELMSN